MPKREYCKKLWDRMDIRLATLFDELDVDMDGGLSAKELLRFFRSLGCGFSLTQVQDMILEFNCVGTLGYQNFHPLLRRILTEEEIRALVGFPPISANRCLEELSIEPPKRHFYRSLQVNKLQEPPASTNESKNFVVQETSKSKSNFCKETKSEMIPPNSAGREILSKETTQVRGAGVRPKRSICSTNKIVRQAKADKSTNLARVFEHSKTMPSNAKHGTSLMNNICPTCRTHSECFHCLRLVCIPASELQSRRLCMAQLPLLVDGTHSSANVAIESRHQTARCEHTRNFNSNHQRSQSICDLRSTTAPICREEFGIKTTSVTNALRNKERKTFPLIATSFQPDLPSESALQPISGRGQDMRSSGRQQKLTGDNLSQIQMHEKFNSDTKKRDSEHNMRESLTEYETYLKTEFYKKKLHQNLEKEKLIKQFKANSLKEFEKSSGLESKQSTHLSSMLKSKTSKEDKLPGSVSFANRSDSSARLKERVSKELQKSRDSAKQRISSSLEGEIRSLENSESTALHQVQDETEYSSLPLGISKERSQDFPAGGSPMASDEAKIPSEISLEDEESFVSSFSPTVPEESSFATGGTSVQIEETLSPENPLLSAGSISATIPTSDLTITNEMEQVINTVVTKEKVRHRYKEELFLVPVKDIKHSSGFFRRLIDYIISPSSFFRSQQEI